MGIVQVKSSSSREEFLVLGCGFTAICHHRSFSGRGKAALHNRATDYFFSPLFFLFFLLAGVYPFFDCQCAFHPDK